MKARVFARRIPAARRAAPAFVRRSAAGAHAVRSIVQSPVPSGGQPLPSSVRAHMEPRFGADFSDVRVHANGEAAASAAAINARAYTFGRDVVFGAGQYSPETTAGRRLVAHELAHVVQQHGDGASSRVQRQFDPTYAVDDPYSGVGKTGAPARIFFGRNSDKIPTKENAKIDAFKSGANQKVSLTLLGLATEDELASMPSLPADRSKAVDASLGTPLAAPPKTKHEGARAVTPGSLANTQDQPDLRFNRAVELLRPGESSWNPGTKSGLAKDCKDPTEASFQKAKEKAFEWIDATRREVQKRPVAGAIAADMAKFFGNHDASTARRLDHNLELIKAELERLAKPDHHKCGEPNYTACFGNIAFNSLGGASAKPVYEMTVCSDFASHSIEEQASVLVHEASHSTAGLRITGKRNVKGPGTLDLAYRHERLVNILGQVNADEALSNADSYAMFLVARQSAPTLAKEGQSPPADPAPSGFADPKSAEDTARAVAFAQEWIRAAWHQVNQLHGVLVILGVGEDLLAPGLANFKRLFPPILSTPKIRAEDLLMVAGVLDRYAELRRLMQKPIAMSPGGATRLTAGAASHVLTVSPVFLGMPEEERIRSVVDRAIEALGTSQISVAMRPKYGEYAQLVHGNP